MKKHIATFLIGLLGGIVGAVLFTASPLMAALTTGQFRDVNIYNADGKRAGTFSASESNEGVLFLFGENGKTTVQMGAYSTGSEKGQALIGLNDPLNQLRLLFRLHSNENSPTMVMKDRYGVDKIVLGLRGENQTPYLEYTKDDGRVVNLLGD